MKHYEEKKRIEIRILPDNRINLAQRTYELSSGQFYNHLNERLLIDNWINVFSLKKKILTSTSNTRNTQIPFFVCHPIEPEPVPFNL
jgi:hypothetical protein